jgi:hypothetical protein
LLRACLQPWLGRPSWLRHYHHHRARRRDCVYPRCRLTWWMGDSDLTDYDRMRVDRRCTMVKGERCVMGVSVQGRRKEGHNTRREGVGGASVEQWRAHLMSPTPKIHCAHRPLGLRGMIATHYKKLLIALLSTIILSGHIQHNQQPSISHNVCLCQSSTHSLTLSLSHSSTNHTYCMVPPL